MSKKVLFIALSLAFLAVNSVYAQEFVTDGLIAMWTFDEGTINGDQVEDVSGNGNDATIMGTVKFTDGVIGQAALFDARHPQPDHH
jgi:hypothetical protein